MRNHFVVCGLTLCVTLLTAATSLGQHYQPFAELDIDYDWQLFAPPIIEEYGDEPVAPNYGWFANYNRAYVSLTRPDNISSGFQEDKTWGNIWNVGYMTDDNDGWLVSIVSFQNANVSLFTAVTDIQGNDLLLQNSLNGGSYSGVEVNKTFRVHLGQHGTYFEPFGGFRYGEFQEELNFETLVFDVPLAPLAETGTGTRGVIHNTLVGGQLGCRSFMRNGHWIISGEFRGFAQMNFQESAVRQTQITTINDGAGGFIVTNPIITQVDQSFDEFVVGGELRLEAAYELTRDVRAKIGMELLHFGRGIGRGFDPVTLTAASFNDQATTYLGYYVGLEWNR